MPGADGRPDQGAVQVEGDAMSEKWHDAEEYTSPEGLTWKPRVPLYRNICKAMPLFEKPSGASRTAGDKPDGEVKDRRPISGVSQCDNALSATCGTGGSGELRITRPAEDMLILAYREPLTKTELRERMGPLHGRDGKMLSGHKGKKYMEELIRSGYALEVRMPVNRHGRPPELLEVTPKGRTFLERIGEAGSQRSGGRGGVLHRRCVEEIRRQCKERGHTVRVEARLGTAYMDVLEICNDGTRTAFQVVMSTEAFEGKGAREALEAGVEELVFVVEDEVVMERLRSRIESVIRGERRSRVRYELVSSYVG